MNPNQAAHWNVQLPAEPSGDRRPAPREDDAYDDRITALADTHAVAQLHHRWATAISVAVQAISAVPGMPAADRTVILADLDGALGYHARPVHQARDELARIAGPGSAVQGPPEPMTPTEGTASLNG